MNEEMVRLWNETVSPEDTVIYLGDFSLSFKAVEKFLPRLNGTKLLISGNHDKCWRGKPQQVQIYLDAGFKEVYHRNSSPCYFPIEQGVTVKLSHIPYDNHDDRYLDYLPEDNGMTLYHGHVHTCWKIKRSQKGSLMINVGVPVWDYRPVSLEQIEKEIDDFFNLEHVC